MSLGHLGLETTMVTWWSPFLKEPYAHINVYIYIYLRMRVYVYLQIYVYMYICICVCIYIYMCVYACMYACKYVSQFRYGSTLQQLGEARRILAHVASDSRASIISHRRIGQGQGCRILPRIGEIGWKLLQYFLGYHLYRDSMGYTH